MNIITHTQGQQMKNKNRTKLLTIFITIVLVAILLSHIQISTIIITLTGVNVIYLLMGFALYVLSYFFRTLRFYILLDKKVCLKNLFSIVCVHNMTNNLLPARTGELSYVYFLKKTHNISIKDGVATLLFARIFDFIAICLIFIISMSFLTNVPEMILQIKWIVVMALLLTIVVMGVFIFYCEKAINLLKFYFYDIAKIKLVNKLFTQLYEISRRLNTQGNKKIAYTFSLSFMIWFSSFLMGYLIITDMGIQLDIWALLIGLTFTVLISILPVHGVGGFGTMEGAWPVIFISLGVGKELAISTGFAYHIVIIIFTLLTGIYGLIILKKNS